MLGFSFVSFIEILYWVSGRLARNCMRKANSEEGLTVAELGNVRKVSVYENVQMSDLLNFKIGNWEMCSNVFKNKREKKT